MTREVEGYLRCGDPREGFAWLVCGDCDHHRLVPFTCKGRGFCPSCGGRRMADRAARWVDTLLPRVAVRQVVVTVREGRVIRVRDLEKSLDFYTRILGMKVLRQKEYPGGKFTNTFVGYGPEDSNPAIELTHNWDQEELYDKGNGFGHIAIEGPCVYEACDRLRADGVKIFIGEEAGYDVFGDYSVITAPYTQGNRTLGVLGVIGPTRMAYERVIPMVDVTAKMLSAALSR